MNKDLTISVVGAGTAGCFTVLYLSENLPDVKIKWVVESLTNNIGVGEATVPTVQEFLTDLGYNIQYIIKNCAGTMKLGVKFVNFSDKTFWHPFGNTRDEQEELLYISRKNKIPDNIFEYSDIATHFDVSILIKDIYANISKRKNVDIVKSSSDCDINIMCTGFDTDNKFIRADKILNNQAIIYRCPSPDSSDNIPYTTCTGRDHGWSWKIPLGSAITYGYVNDGHPDAYNEFTDCLRREGVDIDHIKPRILNFNCGRLDQHITSRGKKIYCNIGLSSCFLEPMEATGLYFITQSIKTIEKFIKGSIDIHTYNKIINDEFDSIYNFIVAHYSQSSNQNYYWSKQKLQTYERQPNNLFPESSWDYILNGLQHGTPDNTPRGNIINIAAGKNYNDWVNNM